MNPTTFEYLKPTDAQLETMQEMRKAFADITHQVEDTIRPSADKDYVIRLLRTAAMWANVAITREADGTPRQ